MTIPRPAAAALAAVLLAAAACDRDPAGDPPAADPPAAEPRAAEPPAAEPPIRRDAAPWRAIGTEPFWGLQITAEGLRFTTPDDPEGRRFPPAAPVTRGDTLHWNAVAGGAALDARIWPAECSDGMSDKVWTHAARVVLDGTTWAGCAEAQAAPGPADRV